MTGSNSTSGGHEPATGVAGASSQSAPPEPAVATAPTAPSSTAALAASIATAVTGQIAQHVTATTDQLSAQIVDQRKYSRRITDENSVNLRAEFGRQLEMLANQIDRYQRANDAHQHALQDALEERLAEFANDQHGRLAVLEAKLAEPATAPVAAAVVDPERLTELEARVARMPAQLDQHDRISELEARVAELPRQLLQRIAELESTVAAQPAATDHRDWIGHIEARVNELPAQFAARLAEIPDASDEIAAVTADLQLQLDGQTAVLNAKLEELQRSARRFDEQASALVQHVNDTSTALSRRLDDSAAAIAASTDAQLATAHAELELLTLDVQRQLSEQAVTVSGKLESADTKVTDRMLALEARMNEEAGTKIAGLEATIGRIGAGFDDALGALSQRFLDTDNHLHESDERLDAVIERVSRIDEQGLEDLKQQMSSAIGEAMLVRIEVDRVVQSTDEKLDRHSLRMAEIEGQLVDHMDVSTAVQLERLDELERAVGELDPDQFVRKSDTGNGGATATAPGIGDVNQHEAQPGHESDSTAHESYSTF